MESGNKLPAHCTRRKYRAHPLFRQPQPADAADRESLCFLLVLATAAADLLLVRRMRLTILGVVAAAICSSTAMAHVDEAPPVDDQTIIGVWEGLLQNPPAPITLFWMQMTATGDSYLVQVTPGAGVGGGPSYVVYKLIPSESYVAVGKTATVHSSIRAPFELTGTPISLHFRRVSPEPGELWIKGILLTTVGQFGSILCTSFGGEVWFIKGTWAEELGKASEKATDAIKQQPSK